MPNVSSADGPIAVTGAAGYIGCHTVHAFVERGYTVRACVRDTNAPDKVDHLKTMNDEGLPGTVEVVEGGHS